MGRRRAMRVSTSLSMRPGTGEDGVPMLRLELSDDDGMITSFDMNVQTAESVCLSLALWFNRFAPGQSVPTSTRLQ